jgi:hypothetical protein
VDRSRFQNWPCEIDVSAHGEHVHVGGDGGGLTAAPHPHARDGPVGELQPLDRGVGKPPHALALEVAEPRIDPRLGGRRVEQPARLVVHREEDVADEDAGRLQPDGAGAGLLGLGGDQVPGQRAGEQVLVERAEALGPHEVPPAQLVVLVVPPGVARRDELGQPGGEVQQLVQLQAGDDPEQADQRLGQVGDRVDGEQLLVRERDVERVLPREPGRLPEGQVVLHAVGVGPVGDPRHGVDDVAVVAGEEPEAVLAR